MKETLEHNRHYQAVAKRLLKKYPDKFKDIIENDIKIAFLSSDAAKRKNRKIVYADCNPVSNRYKWTCRYDFFIAVYEPNVIDFEEWQIEILLEHELMHIGVDYGGNEPIFYTVPHDIEEFWDIIDEHGINWSVT